MKNSNFSLDEPALIATIRIGMGQLEQLAMQWHKNYTEQWEVYSRDIAAPKKPGRFTYLAENQTRISEECTTIQCKTIMQMSHYDAHCDQKSIAYSDNWNNLLAELRAYLGGPSLLSTHLNFK